MILGDLLDARVLDPDGAPLGHVVDVRLAVELREETGSAGDEPDGDEENGGEGGGEKGGENPDEQPLAGQVRRHDAVGRAEVVGLLVSPRTGTSFLGFERTDVRSPWLIAALVRRLHRGTFLVAWEDVAEIGDDTVTLGDGFERRDPGLE